MSSTRMEEDGESNSSSTSTSGRSNDGTSCCTSSTSASDNEANDAANGRNTVHARLRSILMSPTCYTLFRGFHPTAGAATAAATTTTTGSTDDAAARVTAVVYDPNTTIQGLPPFPNFWERSQCCTTSAIFSKSVNAANEIPNAAISGRSKKKRKAEEVVGIAEDTPVLKADAGKDAAAEEESLDPTTRTYETVVDDRAGTAGSTDLKLNVTVGDAADETTTAAAAAIRENRSESNKTGNRQDAMAMDQVSESVLLTGCIQEILHEQIKEDKHELFRFSVENQQVPVCSNREGGITNLVFSRHKHDGQELTIKEPLGIVEFGLLEEASTDVLLLDPEKLETKFWAKMDQATRYLPVLRRDSTWTWEKKSLLLGVLVATRDCTLGRFAVFVCEPRGVNDWRMALMWRSQLDTTEKLSDAFGAFLNAVNYLAEHEEKLANKEITWKYLGPHCKLVIINGQKYVLRSYDNRVHQSSRSPRVYKSWKGLHDHWAALKMNMISLILELDDEESNTLDFATTYEGETRSFDKSMLFSKWNKCKGGKVEVIAVPYEEGTHECTSIIQVLSLLFFLKKMHHDKFVHGDLRGRNIVFLKVPNEKTISDFLQQTQEPGAKNDEHVAHKPQLSIDQPVANDQEDDAGAAQVANDPQDVNDKKVLNEQQAGNDHQAASDQQDTRLLSANDQKVADVMQAVAEDLRIAEDTKFSIIEGAFKYACLIDYDYGGRISEDNNPRYPPNYKRNLQDGNRGNVEEGDIILPVHDVYAATQVLTHLHELPDNKYSMVADRLWEKLRRSRDLTQQIEYATQLLKLCRAEYEDSVCPTDNYKEHLKSITS